MIEYDDLIGTRNIKLKTRFLVQHILVHRTVTQQRDPLFEMLALAFQNRQLPLTRYPLAFEPFGCPQTVIAMDAMIAEVGKKRDRHGWNHETTDLFLPVMLCPHKRTLERITSMRSRLPGRD